jgi:hypothetical protein
LQIRTGETGIVYELYIFYSSSSIIPSTWDDRPDSQISQSTSPPRSPSPVTVPRQTISNAREPSENSINPSSISEDRSQSNKSEDSPVKEKSSVSLEEENRQLKEARLCKVCMDSEVITHLLYLCLLISLVWCPGQNKRIAPLSFLHGCRKRRLND